MIFDISAACPIDWSITDIFDKLYRIRLPLFSSIGLTRKLSRNFFTRSTLSMVTFGPFKPSSKNIYYLYYFILFIYFIFIYIYLFAI